MQNLLKTWDKNGFSIEIYTTKCGSLAYLVFDGELEIFHNNNFYPSKEIDLNDDSDLMIFELIKTLENEIKYLDKYYLSLLSKKKQEWIKSDRFSEFINLIPDGVLK